MGAYRTCTREMQVGLGSFQYQPLLWRRYWIPQRRKAGKIVPSPFKEEEYSMGHFIKVARLYSLVVVLCCTAMWSTLAEAQPFAYVANNNNGSNNVSVIDTSTNAVVAKVSRRTHDWINSVYVSTL